MATIKAYTDLNQSRKLAEFLPHESADMRFCFSHTLDGRTTGHYPMIGREPSLGTIPCWSLAALLGVLSFPALRYDIEGSEGGWIVSCEKNDKMYLSYYKDNPVDTCYEMIIKLHELKML